MIGSSNITSNALKGNLEWNIKLNSMSNGEVISDVEKEFSKMWSEAQILTEFWINAYKKVYTYKKEKYLKDEVVDFQGYKIKPNKMQALALDALENLRKKGRNKGLLISATGTGKTYLSAFDVALCRADKVLFIAHREQILKQAMNSYKRVLSYKKSMMILSGNTVEKSKSINCDVVFATIQTMSKEYIMSLFEKEHFDYIIIDETHRAGAKSYKKVIDYFNPKFLLGMTATPERSDDNDIYELYDHNIAYEIRLKHAMQNNLLCPFCYFGISDLEVKDRNVKDELKKIKRDEKKVFKYLTSDERIKYIDEKIKFYGYSGKRLRGLMFASSVKECEELSKKLNKIGYRTKALSGKNSEEERENAIMRLEQEEDNETALDYIITRDIFNEGVDIPSVNQVVMLRPTQSSIVFVQQLGRGLRKYIDKEFVTIIDFIGNYENNYMIPIALSGDRTLKKQNLRDFIGNVSSMNIGLCNIEFDRITEQRIYNSIDSAKLNGKNEMRDYYKRVKNMIGRIPSIIEFDTYGEVDPIKYFEASSPFKYCGKKAKSYHEALKDLDESYKVEYSETQRIILEIICQKLVNGKRIAELIMLKNMIEDEKNFLKKTIKELKDEYKISMKGDLLVSCINVLTGEFEVNENNKKKSRKGSMISRKKEKELKFENVAEYEPEYIENYRIYLSENFKEALKDTNFKKDIKDYIALGMRRYNEEYNEKYRDTDFCINRTYSYEDVCRLLKWKKNIVPLNIGGYRYDSDTNTFPVFINYHKSEDISATIAYKDRFIDRRTLKAISKSNKDVNSPEIKRIYSQSKNNMRIFLFLRKTSDSDDAKEFYFLGEMKSVGEPKQIIMNNTDGVKAVEITYKLLDEINAGLYNYFVNK